jgi:hypothetical protein
MTTKAELLAQAAELKAVNGAKHKATGHNFRLELRVHGLRGVKKVVVFYLKNEPTVESIVRRLLDQKSKCLSDYLLEAI